MRWGRVELEHEEEVRPFLEQPGNWGPGTLGCILSLLGPHNNEQHPSQKRKGSSLLDSSGRFLSNNSSSMFSLTNIINKTLLLINPAWKKECSARDQPIFLLGQIQKFYSWGSAFPYSGFSDSGKTPKGSSRWKNILNYHEQHSQTLEQNKYCVSATNWKQFPGSFGLCGQL